MPRKPAPKPDDPAEYKRFLETAKAAEAETDPKAFDKAFKRLLHPSKKGSQRAAREKAPKP